MPTCASTARWTAEGGAAGGRLLYALDASAGGVVVVDTTTSRVAARVALPDEAEDVAVSPDGLALYVTSGRALRFWTAPG